MAKATTKTKVEIEESLAEVETEANVKEAKEETKEPVKEKTVKKEKRKFAPDEGIPCRSVTVGGLYMEGIKSKILYQWSNIGDITDVEYQDLLSATRSSNKYIMSPRFIIEDEDFIEQNPTVARVYENMYDVTDYNTILIKMPVREMVDTIVNLPQGVQDSIKHCASELVVSGKLDSITKIKQLDKLFNTNLKMLAGF